MFLEVWRLSGQLYVLVSSFIFEEVQDLLLRLCVACTGNTPMFSMCDCVQCVVVFCAANTMPAIFWLRKELCKFWQCAMIGGRCL